MLKFLLVSLEVYLYVILTTAGDMNHICSGESVFSVFLLLAAAANTFFTFILSYYILLFDSCCVLQQYSVLLGLNLAVSLGFCSIASTNGCQFSFCESLTVWMCLYIYKCTECLSKASCHWCL